MISKFCFGGRLINHLFDEGLELVLIMFIWICHLLLNKLLTSLFDELLELALTHEVDSLSRMAQLLIL